MPPQDPRGPVDPTPEIASETDISRLGRTSPTPAHEKTAAQDLDVVDWKKLAASPKFHELLKAKRRFIIPAMIFFIVYYFALPALVGYAPGLMERRVWGAVNIAYLFALSQFFMAWIIAALYVRAAARFDRMAREVIEGQEQVRSEK